ncbi:MAG: hypothetical protein AAGA68_18625 [Pseudomonadota bacterium]
MTVPSHTGRFWRGAGVGVVLGLTAVVGLGWWLASEPQTGGPPPAVTPLAPSPPASPTPMPSFAPPVERLADQDAQPPAASQEAVAIEQMAASAAAMSRSDVVEAQELSEEAVARETPSVVDAADRRALEVAEEPIERDALRLRDRFDSLSDALLTEEQSQVTAILIDPIGGDLLASAEALSDPPPSSGQWIDVWQPFTSPVSARGFADRLELLTGFTYRVQRRPGDGLHQVAVLPVPGYAPEQMLRQIADRSGLAMASP